MVTIKKAGATLQHGRWDLISVKAVIQADTAEDSCRTADDMVRESRIAGIE